MRLATSQITLLAVLASGLLACTDTFARFDEFDQRVPDAAPPEPEPDAEVLLNLPDVTGTFLFALAASISPDPPFQFLADVELDNDRLTITLTGLDRYDRTPVGGPPLTATDVVVDETGAFEAPLQGEISGDANVLTGNDLVVDVTIVGRIQDEDTFCGQLNGKILQPVQLDVTGSTVGAIRVTEGVVGDELPEPLVACPE